MKKFRIPLLILCLCLMLSGCSFRLDSIEDLISPISPNGENADVLSAVDDYCKNGYSLKIPSAGNYTTSFVYYDIDNDKQAEAIAFYEPSDKKGIVNMAVIDKAGEQWNVVDNVEGDGGDIISIEFCDVNNDSEVELVVCWSIISKSTNHSLRVYKQSGKDNIISLKAISSSITASDFLCVDVNDDKMNELLVFKLGSAANSPKAELYSFKNNSQTLLCETKLDASIISFSALTVGKTDQGTSVFADALNSNDETMVTELIYWSDYYNSIISPFYNYNTGRTSETTRKNTIVSRDIDDDGIIEIPLSVSRKSLPSQLSVENWMYYNNTVLNHSCYSYSCQRDKYIIVIPDKIYSKLSFDYDEKSRETIATETKSKKEAFRIKAVIASEYDSANYKDYTLVYNNSGFVYLAKTGNSDVSVSIDDLKSMMKSY